MALPRIKYKQGTKVNVWCPFRVGDIIPSTNGNSPEPDYPGTKWELYAQDRFLVGAGSAYGIGAIGGAAIVTLTVDQIPSHSHLVNYGNSLGSNGTVCAASNLLGSNSSAFIRNTGGGAAHENRPPYIAVYFWRRTA